MPKTTERPPTEEVSPPKTKWVPPSSKPSPRKNRGTLKKWLIGAGIFLILVGALTPLAAKWVVNYVLKNQFSSTIALKHLGFNPITGKLDLSVEKNSQLVLDRHQMEWDWLPFLRRTIRLNDVHLKDLTVEVKHFADGSVQIGDIRVENLGESASKLLKSTAWTFPIYVEVRNVVLENIKVKYTGPQFQATLAFDRLQLKATGSSNKAFVRVGVLKNLAQRLDFTGDIRVTGLHLELPINPQAAAPKKSSTFQKLQGLSAQLSGLATFSDLHVELLPGEKPGRWIPVFRVASMEVTDNAAFRLQGKGFRTPLDVKFQPLNFQLKNLDSTRPGEEVALTLETVANKPSKIRHTLAGTPLEKPFSVTGKGKITRFDLAPFSPLAERFIGYRVKSGKINLDSVLSVKRGILDSKMDVMLNRLEVEKLKTAELDPLADQLGLPLESGLMLLKDKEGNIQLEIPLKADLNDPDQVMSSVVSAGFAAAVDASIKKVFSPFASGKNYEMAPLTFARKEAALSNEARQYLNEVGKLLAERPGVKLKIKGFGPAAEAKLIAKRVENVKAHLMTTFAILPERLLISNPEVSDDKAAASRVELSL